MIYISNLSTCMFNCLFVCLIDCLFDCLVFVCLFGVCLFVWSLLASICPSISLINLFTDCVVINPNLLILIHLHTYYEESLMMVG